MDDLLKEIEVNKLDQMEEQKSFEVFEEVISPSEIKLEAQKSDSSSEEDEATDMESLKKMVRKMLKPQLGVYFAD